MGNRSRTMLLITAMVVALLLGSGIALAAAGDLDASFGGDGVVQTNLYDGKTLSRAEYAADVVAQPDGKTVVTGFAYPYNVTVRYTVGGQLDGGFNGDGIAGGGGRALVLQPDDKIVASGVTNRAGHLTRYTANGALDKTFGGGDGRVASVVYDGLVRQGDGKLVAGGTPNTGDDFVLVRRNADGTLDRSFGGDGKVTTDFGGSERLLTLAQQPGGKVVAAGSTTAGGAGSAQFALSRYNYDGTLDRTFGGDGRVMTDVTRGFDLPSAVLVQPDGKTVVTGAALVRYKPNGALDLAFGGGDGIVSKGGGDVVAQTDGKLVTAGGARVTGPDRIRSVFEIRRYDPSGNPDASFGGGDGTVTTDVGGEGGGSAGALALRGDGRLVAAGAVTTECSDFANEPLCGDDIVLARYLGQ